MVGYVAAMEWRRVHVLRPRASTSAGQSVVVVVVVVVVAVEEVVDKGFDAVEPGAFMDLAWEAQAEKALLELQERQLLVNVSNSSQSVNPKPTRSQCKQRTAFRQAQVSYPEAKVGLDHWPGYLENPRP